MAVRTVSQMMSRAASATRAEAFFTCANSASADSARNDNAIMLILDAVITASILISIALIFALILSSVITLGVLVSVLVLIAVSVLVLVSVLLAVLICGKVHHHRMRRCA